MHVRPYGWLAMCAAMIVIILGVNVLVPSASLVVAHLLCLLAGIGALVILGLRIRREPNAARLPRILIALTTLLLVLGVLVMLVAGNSPGSVVAMNLCFLAAIPVCAFGILSYPPIEATPGMRVRTFVDGAIAATALWSIIYMLVLYPQGVGMNSEGLGRAMALVYPAAGVLVISIVLAMSLRICPEYRIEITLIAAGFIALTTERVISSITDDFGLDTQSGTAYAFMVVCFGLIGASGLVASKQPPVDDWSLEDEPSVTDNRSRLLPLLPPAMVGVVMLLGIGLALRGQSVTSIGYLIGLVLLGLLIIQQVLAAMERTRLSERLQASNRLFKSLVVGSTDLITLHTADGTVKYASPAVVRVTGLGLESLIGEQIWRMIHPDDIADVQDKLRDLLRYPDQTVEMTLRVVSADSSYRWMQTVVHNMLGDPSVEGVVCNTRDIHEQQLLRQRLSFEAYHDTLTGLGNLALARRVFAEHCYGVDRTPATLLLADLDGFKALNDTFGHPFGDELLIAVARRLLTCVSDEDAVARIGGDEFVLVFESERDAQTAATEVLNALRRPLLVQGTTVALSASIGIARSVDATTPEELLRNADLAMYAAKTDGGNTLRWYDTSLFENTVARLKVQEGLRAALEHDRFTLNFQPIVSLPSGELTGAEVLLRWTDPELGFVPPDQFIPVAEGSGIIAEIDRWVIQKSCEAIARWRDAGKHVPTVSVNVSRRQLTGGLAALIAETMERHQLDPDLLCVEVTESAVVPDAFAAAGVLHELRELGVRIALDDFGTGQSSLSQLAQMPIDRVKIDKSFVMPSSTDPEALRLLRSIVGVCRSLELPIVAEGIEDAGAVRNLSAMGVQFGQGYHFSRPVPEAEFATMLRNNMEIPRQRRRDLLANNFQVVSDKEAGSADARDAEEELLEFRRSS